jgi:hypothetical protein
MRLRRSANTSTSRTQIAVSRSIGGRAVVYVWEGWNDGDGPGAGRIPRTPEKFCGGVDVFVEGDATTEVPSSLSNWGAPSMPYGVASRTDTEALPFGYWGGVTSAGAVCTTSGSGDVFTSLTGSDVERSLGGSGKHSRFDRLQREQTHSLDLHNLEMSDRPGRGKQTPGADTHKAARRFRSLVGTSSAPTPIAACPFKGKKPCNPIMASE